MKKDIVNLEILYFKSSSRTPEDGATDEEREHIPQLQDNQPTTSEEGSGSIVDPQTDTSEDPSDLSEDQEDAVVLFGDPHRDFSDAIEPFFVKVVILIERERFYLGSAKDFVLTLRDLGQRHVTRGCAETMMEDIVLRRALRTVHQLVDGVNLVSEQKT